MHTHAQQQQHTHAHTASNKTLSVSSHKARVQSLTLSGFPQNTLSLIVNHSTYLDVRVEFDDQTVFENARTSTSNWISIQEYISFNSTQVHLCSVSNDGEVTIHKNSDKVLNTINVYATTGANTTTHFATNLLPDIGDIDIGSAVGNPFPNVQVGETFSLSVRMNVGNQPLKQFEVYLKFDDSVIHATQVSTGSDWAPYSLVSTLNSPINEVRLASVEINSQKSGSNIEIAVVTFQVVALTDSTSSFDLLIASIQTTNGIDLASQNTYSIASNGYLNVGLGGRRRRRRRRLSSSSSVVLGDVNSDGYFNNQDVFYATRVLVGDVDVNTLTDIQKQQLDPDLNGFRESIDIQYLLYTSAKKFRFLDSAQIYFDTIDENQTDFVFTCNIFDHDSVFATSTSNTIGNTRVILEVRWGAGMYSYCGDTIFQNGVFLSGSFFENHIDRHVLNVSDIGMGIFQTRVRYNNNDVPSSCNVSVDFVVSIVTEDVMGMTDSQRAFPFYGTDWGRFGEAGFSYVPFGESMNITVTSSEAAMITSTEAATTTSTEAATTTSTEAATTTTSTQAATTTTSTQATTTTTSTEAATTTTATPTTSSEQTNTLIYVSAGAGACLLLILLIMSMCFCRRGKKSSSALDTLPSTFSSFHENDGITMNTIISETPGSIRMEDNPGVIVTTTPGPEEGLQWEDEPGPRFVVGSCPSFDKKKMLSPMYLSDSAAFRTPKSSSKEQGGDPDDLMEL